MPINILITGYRGYIGSALVEYLRQNLFVAKIIGYDISEGNDILNCERLIHVLKSNNIFVVIHLAALSSIAVCNKNPTNAIKINAYGTYCILKAMKEAGCNNIIYASTSLVYGNDEYNLPYSEYSKPNPCAAYGISKMLGEHVIFNHYKLQNNPGNYLIFRMFNVIGSSGFAHIDERSHIINSGHNRLFDALESGYITIYGKDYSTFDGTSERDYVALKDVCMAYIKGIKTIMGPDVVRSTINICSGIPISINSIVNKWNKISTNISNKKEDYNLYNKLPYINYTYGPKRDNDPSKVYGSNNKAMKVIGWETKRKMEDIILDLAIDKNFINV